jgi:hypothetical protein
MKQKKKGIYIAGERIFLLFMEVIVRGKKKRSANHYSCPLT